MVKFKRQIGCPCCPEPDPCATVFGDQEYSHDWSNDFGDFYEYFWTNQPPGSSTDPPSFFSIVNQRLRVDGRPPDYRVTHRHKLQPEVVDGTTIEVEANQWINLPVNPQTNFWLLRTSVGYSNSGGSFTSIRRENFSSGFVTGDRYICYFGGFSTPIQQTIIPNVTPQNGDKIGLKLTKVGFTPYDILVECKVNDQVVHSQNAHSPQSQFPLNTQGCRADVYFAGHNNLIGATIEYDNYYSKYAKP